MKAGRAIVHLVFPEAFARETAYALLSSEEKSRAGRFRFEKDANHWIACRASLRSILGNAIQRPPLEVPLVFSEFGKPALAPPFQFLHFNLSHCENLALIVLSEDGPVGIDLEPSNRAPELLECESTFCHPLEIQKLPLETDERSRQLLRIWTAKEAVLKAMGTGLSHPPESTRIQFEQQPAVALSYPELPGLEFQRLHELIHRDLRTHQAFVSAPSSVKSIEII